ncbi:hypothetical protein [Bacillus sp. JCM 19034]|uniref:hypothetical protein n=1 Tax=Bacillus sp. JCM 19034 TaxID=1481928 RepID=UPI0007828DCD|nr:hypothetical protein [Bacillus sp. JCM 19034]
MWELLIYLMVAPVMTIVLSLVFAIKYHDYYAAPMLVFILLNFPTIIFSMNYSIGWEILFGWSIFYTFLSLFISFFVWFIQKNKHTSKTV